MDWFWDIETYEVTVTANRFENLLHEHVTVALQQHVVLNFKLQVAQPPVMCTRLQRDRSTE